MEEGMIPRGSIKMIGETVGTELSDEISIALAKDVEYRIREILQEAVKFMRHSKREKLLAEDIDNAMKLRNVEVLYGYSTKNNFTFKKPPGYKDLFYIDDAEIDIETAIESCPMPIPMISDSFNVFWLEKSKSTESSNDGEKNNENEDEIDKNEDENENENEKEIEYRRELEIYHNRMMSILLGNDNEAIKTVLSYLSQDAMIHKLVPIFCQYLFKIIKDHLKNIKVLIIILKSIQAILNNPNVIIDQHLNEIITIVLTCLIGRKLGESFTDDHWYLRDFAANVLLYIWERWGYEYANLQSRIIKTLTQTLLNFQNTLSSHYGCIIGLTKLGHEIIQLTIIPNLRTYFKHLKPVIEQYDNPIKKYEAEKVLQALHICCGFYLYEAILNEKTTDLLEDSKDLLKDESFREKLKDDEIENYDDILKSIEDNDLVTLHKNYEKIYDLFGENICNFVPRIRCDPGTELFM